ncbi:MAG: HEAT repeat domain-containing protein [Planctomycetes bacterium]|nr:HEAT repeat domain-containing protein [Planctomycetota bacterium]
MGLKWVLFLGLSLAQQDADQSDSVQTLIKQLGDDDIMSRKAAAGKLVDLWEDPALKKIIEDNIDTARKNNNPDLRVRLEEILAKIEFRHVLGKELVEKIKDEIDDIYDADEKVSFEYFERWLGRPSKYHIDGEKEQRKLTEWIYEKLESFQVKQKFSLFFASRSNLKFGREFVARLLKDNNPQVRLSAVMTLGTLRAAEYTDEMVELLDDPDINVRTNTLINLANYMNPVKYMDKISGLLDDQNVNVQSYAIYALGRMPAKKYEERIASFLKDENVLIKIQAIRALGSLKSVQYADEIAKFIDHSNQGVKTAAMVVLGQMKAQAYVKDIVKQLDDEDKSVKEDALRALYSFGAKEYHKEIAKLLDDPDPEVKSVAAFVIGEFGLTEYAEKIAEMIENNRVLNNLWAGRDSIHALALLGEKKYEAKIADFLNSNHEMLRYSAISAISMLGSKERAKDIAELLGTNDFCAKAYVIIALGDMGAKEYADKIADLLDYKFEEQDEEEDSLYESKGVADVKSAALYALGEFGEIKFADKVAKFLSDGHPRIRASAVAALGRLNAKEFSKEISKLLQDNDYVYITCTDTNEQDKRKKGVMRYKETTVCQEAENILKKWEAAK